MFVPKKYTFMEQIKVKKGRRNGALLALGRKPGEYVMIGDDIMVKVIKSEGQLRLAIEAPKSIPIVRGEVYEEMKLAQQKQQLCKKAGILKTDKPKDIIKIAL